MMMRFFAKFDAANAVHELQTTDARDIQPEAGFVEIVESDARLLAYLAKAGENMRGRRISFADFFAMFTNAEQTLLWAFLASHPQALGQILLGLADGQLDLTGAKAKAICDALVASGVVTPARAVQILAGARQQFLAAATLGG